MPNKAFEYLGKLYFLDQLDIDEFLIEYKKQENVSPVSLTT